MVKNPYRIEKSKFLETNFFVPNKNFEWSSLQRDSKSHFNNVDVKQSLYEIVKPIENTKQFNLFESDKIISKNKTVECDFMKCKQVRIFPNDFQRKTLLSWIDLARITYNITLKYVKNHGLKSNQILRETIINDIFSKSFKSKLFEERKDMNKKWFIPCNVIRESIKDVLKSYKTSNALLKARLIKGFNVKEKSKFKLKQSIVIASCDFNKSKNSFYHTFLKEMNSKDFNLSDIKNIYKCDVRLTYNQRTKVFMLNIPIRKDFDKLKISTKKFNVCGIDPGLKTFITIYNPEGECEKIFNRDKIKRLTNLCKKKYSLNKLKVKKRKHYKALIKVNYKIECFRKEVHYKTANYICSKYNEIYLGKLHTKSFISTKNKMRPEEKLYGLALSHCSFRTILEKKALEYNVKLNLVKEHYTSKTCGVCGTIKEIKKDREYICNKCNSHLDRDLNAARNILIKHFSLTSN